MAHQTAVVAGLAVFVLARAYLLRQARITPLRLVAEAHLMQQEITPYLAP